MACYYIVLIIIITYSVGTVIRVGNLKMNGVWPLLSKSFVINAILVGTVCSYSDIDT